MCFQGRADGPYRTLLQNQAWGSLRPMHSTPGFAIPRIFSCTITGPEEFFLHISKVSFLAFPHLGSIFQNDYFAVLPTFATGASSTPKLKSSEPYSMEFSGPSPLPFQLKCQAQMATQASFSCFHAPKKFAVNHVALSCCEAGCALLA